MDVRCTARAHRRLVEAVAAARHRKPVVLCARQRTSPTQEQTGSPVSRSREMLGSLHAGPRQTGGGRKRRAVPTAAPNFVFDDPSPRNIHVVAPSPRTIQVVAPSPRTIHVVAPSPRTIHVVAAAAPRHVSVDTSRVLAGTEHSAGRVAVLGSARSIDSPRPAATIRGNRQPPTCGHDPWQSTAPNPRPRSAEAIVRDGRSRRRRGHDVNIPRRRVV